MNAKGTFVLAIMWIVLSLVWFFLAENPALGIMFLCVGVIALISGLVRENKEKKSK